jgi:aspartyl-tRNA(Asn)/glutamyl-tRNA(Gln) amidotransferase subunit B
MIRGYEPVIGLEVHCQLSTQSKLFCGCSTKFGVPPNHSTCPVCLALPGVLPVLNEQVLRYAIRVGAALGCRIRTTSRFARKNYFYPDLPKGYQISQFDEPILEGGAVVIDLDGQTKSIPLTRIHIEEDAGKSIHLGDRNESHVDYNRTGVPLIEIVSEPALTNSNEVVAYLKELRNIVCYLDVCDGHMEQGRFRCDANVSVRPVGQTELGTRAELKNLNSFNFVKRAVDYEIERQIDVIESGEAVVQETRLWDERANRSRSMRGKEEAHDYRYFPDPDLLPIQVSDALIQGEKEALPELPRARRERYAGVLGLTQYDADVLTGDKSLSDFFEAVCREGAPPKLAANWVQGELLGRLNADGKSIEQSPVGAEELAIVLDRIHTGQISGKQAKQVFQSVYDGMDVHAALDVVGEQLTDSSVVVTIINEVLDAHPGEVSTYLSGKTKVLGFFVGQVMRATQGKANPAMVNEHLREQLEARRAT